jgi:hypothetical protein
MEELGVDERWEAEVLVVQGLMPNCKVCRQPPSTHHEAGSASELDRGEHHLKFLH